MITRTGLLAGILALAAGGAHALDIDDFSGGAFTGAAPIVNQDLGPSSGGFGRLLNATSNNPGLTVRINAAPTLGKYSHSQNSGITGESSISYAMGGQNLSGDANAFRVELNGIDLFGILRITVDGVNVDLSTVDIQLDNGLGPGAPAVFPQYADFLFSDFPGVDFSNVSQVVLQVDGTGIGALDATFDTFATVCSSLASSGGSGLDPNGNIDPALCATSMLGDFVWLDNNRNGIQDAGEPGVPGVTATLTGGGADGIINGAGDTTAVMVTDANGLYKFNGLIPGTEYKVTFSNLPADHEFTLQNQGGDDTVDSDADPTTGMTQVVTLAPDEFNDTLDAGIFEPAMLGDFVWFDNNRNGIQDAGEPGVPGVTATLTGGGADGVINGVGDTTAVMVTDGSGLYKFNDLIPGVEYKVTFSNLPANHEFTLQNQGGDDSVDSDADTTTGMTQIVTLAAGEFNDTLDAGIFEPAMLGDFVWFDNNRNGIQDAGEPGVPGVTATLTGGGADGIINGAGDTTAVMVTDANGLYKFNNLVPGVEYKVTFSNLPANHTFTLQNQGGDDSVDSDADPTTGMTQVVTLAPGEFNDTLDAGILAPAMLGDFVWFDNNRNGIQDAGEPGVPGVTATLTGGGADGIINGAGDTTAVMVTDANGLYKFNNLVPGTEYKVTFSNLPANHEFTLQNQGGDDSVDSDADTTTGMTQVVTLTPGEFNDTLDAGIFEPAMLGDFVWFDNNRNGIQDAGEPGVPGVTATLTGGGADGIINGAGDTTAVMVTDGNGLYKFNNLVPGTEYKVTFSNLPANHEFTLQNQGGDDSVDSDADTTTGMTQVVTLAPGEFNDTLDAGIFEPAMLGDFVWFDNNRNGIQDAGEPGVPGVTATLTGGGADGIINGAGDTTAVMVTDGNGLYKFNNLIPGTEYKVTFSNLPANHEFTLQNQGGDDSVDSDADTTTGMTQVVTLAAGEFNDTLDAGIFEPAMLGDFVWDDTDGNGIQDAGEPGVPGVTATLTGGGADGIINGAGDTTAVMVTDGNGLYKFNGLIPGVEYKVTFSNLPAGRSFTLQNQGGDDSVDSDADTTTGMTQVVTLAPGEFNDTLDAGLVSAPSIDVEKLTNGVDADDPNAGDAPLIGVGNLVSWTYVVTNTGTIPLQNVTVVDDQGVAVSCPKSTLAPAESMDCTASGPALNLASAPNVVPGLCGVEPINLMYENIATATGQSAVGQPAQDTDPSHYCNPPVISLDVEKLTNGVDADDPNAGDAPQIAPGDPVTWTYVVTNTGTIALQNVTVADDQGFAVSCPKSTLAPGESMNCIANALADDLETTAFTVVNGMCGNAITPFLYENMGTATGQSPGGQVAQDVDPSHYCNAPPVSPNVCVPTNRAITLTHNQTKNINVENFFSLDPVSCPVGYVIAWAKGNEKVPIKWNHLSGSTYIRSPGGKDLNRTKGAQAIAMLGDPQNGVAQGAPLDGAAGGAFPDLPFDGVAYAELGTELRTDFVANNGNRFGRLTLLTPDISVPLLNPPTQMALDWWNQSEDVFSSSTEYRCMVRQKLRDIDESFAKDSLGSYYGNLRAIPLGNEGVLGVIEEIEPHRGTLRNLFHNDPPQAVGPVINTGGRQPGSAVIFPLFDISQYVVAGGSAVVNERTILRITNNHPSEDVDVHLVAICGEDR